ncbi:MAG TPA: glycosyltransferase family 4 protein [Chitinophagaceae bacterium]|nr:glycosyltransferase family 4 protein [Chitinophagaceae bacterium]
MIRLAIITSHPIQYNAPWFSLLAQSLVIKPKIFYTWSQTETGAKYDPGFGIAIEWDIPLLDGYAYTFVQNTSKKPGSDHFEGIINPTLINEVSEWKPDAVLIIGWNFKSHLKALRYFHSKIPVLFRGDSTLLGNRNWVKRLIRYILLKWVYKHVDMALYVGTENKKYFIKYGLKENELAFTPHAIDNDRFSKIANAGKLKAHNLKRNLKIPGSDKILLYAGKLESVKDPEVLIRAFVESALTTVHLIIVGSGPLETILKVKYKDVPGLHFIPFQNQSDMPIYYELCDVYVLPSKSETWGLAVNEAMACARAVVVSDKCGCSTDLVIEKINGMIFKTGNINELSKKLKIIFDKSSDLMHMGRHSLQKIQYFSFNKIVETLEIILPSLIIEKKK